MMKPLYRTRRLAVLNLAERGLPRLQESSYRSSSNGRSRRTRVGERRRYKGAWQGKAREGSAKKAEGCRRGWKGTQGARYLTSPFLCPQPPSLAFDPLFFLFQGERRRLSVLLSADRPLVFLIADPLVILSCLHPLALFGPRFFLSVLLRARSCFPRLLSAKIVTVLLSSGQQQFAIRASLRSFDTFPSSAISFFLLARHARCLSRSVFFSLSL